LQMPLQAPRYRELAYQPLEYSYESALRRLFFMP
jgi:hypothetical protein